MSIPTSRESMDTETVVHNLVNLRTMDLPPILQKNFTVVSYSSSFCIRDREKDPLTEYNIRWSQDVLPIEELSNACGSTSVTASSNAKSALFQPDQHYGWKGIVAQDRSQSSFTSGENSQQTGSERVASALSVQKILRRCDGPCHKLVALERMQVFSKCSHLVCKSCLQDRRLSCRNVDCVLQVAISFLPDLNKQAVLQKKLFLSRPDYDSIFKEIIEQGQKIGAKITSVSSTDSVFDLKSSNSSTASSVFQLKTVPQELKSDGSSRKKSVRQKPTTKNCARCNVS